MNDRVAYKKMKQIIRDFRPDIVHTHAAKSGAIGRLAAFNEKVPVVVHTFHGHVFHSYFNQFKTKTFIGIEQYLAKRSSGIIAISELQKKELSETYRICAPDKIEIIPLGLDLDTLQVEVGEKRAAFRKQYFLNEDEVAIGIIGRLVPVKNHPLFIDAIAQLKSITKQPFRVFIIGDGDMRMSILDQCAQLNLDTVYFPDNPSPSFITLTSWRTDVDQVLAGLDIIALSSHNEGTPLSLIEAQAGGKPVVSTNVGGVRDVVLQERTGFITSPDSALEMALALQKLVEDKKLRHEYGERGRKHATALFSYQRLAADMSRYYYSLLQSKG